MFVFVHLASLEPLAPRREQRPVPGPRTEMGDGRRRVLVVELWEGVEKTCAHRCVTAGDCPYTLERAHMSKSMENLSILG